MVLRRSVLTRGGSLLAVGLLAGCLSDSEPEEFEFVRTVFSDEDPDRYDTYEDVPEQQTYTIGETVWCLAAVHGVPTDSDGTARLEYTFETETPDGTSWEPVSERDEEWGDVEATDVLVVWERFSTYEEDPPGEYEMTITVEDQFDGEQLRTTESFQLEREG